MGRTRRFGLIGALLVVPALLGLAGCTRFGATLSRPSDPVVLTGAALPKLVGGDPQHIVGFSWDGKVWHQIPVQVDERDLVNPGQIYHLPTGELPDALRHHDAVQDPRLHAARDPDRRVLVDGHLHARRTPNPTFDANDQLSFLANDTGQQAGGSVATRPASTPPPAKRSRPTDPLADLQLGYVYLFHSSTLTGGWRGTNGVQYTFSLDSGSYAGTYKMGTGSLSPNNTWGFNPEHSTVTTPSYTQSSATGGSTTGSASPRAARPASTSSTARHYYVTVGCGRSEDTFDGGASNPGEGAFVVNISGPVRAIRSYIGANSYKWTVNTDLFYPNRQDTLTELPRPRRAPRLRHRPTTTRPAWAA